ncbi:MAG: tetratricopeptide repeat protein [Desulfobacteraceae bacterium]|nr:MAG: tetratricopeptide repeat protein [Desulfobacteraceae bacterium]
MANLSENDPRNDSIDPGVVLSRDRDLFHLARLAMQKNELDRAGLLIQQAIAICPEQVLYRRALGELLLMRQCHGEALEAFREALSIQPHSAEIHFSMGLAAGGAGDPQQSVDHYAQAVALSPLWPEAWFNFGAMLQHLRRTQAAADAFRKAADLRPDWATAWINLGAVLEQSGQDERAFDCWQRALALDPTNSPAHYNCGMVHQKMGRLDAAIHAYEQALQNDPQMAKAHLNLGICHQQKGVVQAAVHSYRRAIAIQPEYARAWYNLAGALVPLGQWDETIACYEKVIALEPENDAAHLNLAVALRKQERIGEALVYCRKALSITPHFAEAQVYLFQLAQHACDWRQAEQAAPDLDRLSAAQLDSGRKPSESPLLSLRRHADPAKNLAVARAWSGSVNARAMQMSGRPEFDHAPRSGNGVIRVGYISQDFKEHAVAHHLRGLLRAHNRERFRIYLYACNPDDGSYYRQQLARSSPHFVEIHALDDAAGAQRIYNDRIDILVDLMGHTQGCRPEIPALRPAPVQVSYLGFLGTSGAPYIDYCIVDPVVVPPGHIPYYTEKLVFFPECYQVNDDRLAIGDPPYQRRDFGLSEEEVVLCSFNQPYKIDRATFSAWLTILKGASNSVLWLLGQNRTARENLCRAAEAAGVGAERLRFAGALRIDRHLARLQLADLALDTFPYNGGATTSNVLWAGVPLLALMGKHFVSRMSASALMAVGLPELVAHSPVEYIGKALDLVHDPEKRNALRNKLGRLKSDSALFATQRFAARLESAFEKMMTLFNNGLTPQSFSIESE